MASETKFKVGDRVRLKEEYSIWGAGIEGVVENVIPGDYTDDDLIYTDTVNGAFARRFELVTAWQPKVGDRVVSSGEETRGEVGTVVEGGYGYDGLLMVKFDTWRRGHDGINLYGNNGKEHWLVPAEDLRPAAVVEPTPLTITAGRYYKTRDGRKVGPMEDYSGGAPGEDLSFAQVNGIGKLFNRDGAHHYKDSNLDLIAEWADEPTAQPVAIANDSAAPAKFKVGDKIRHKGLGHVGYIKEIVDDNAALTFWTNVGWGATDPFGDIELITQTPTTPAIVALIENGVAKPSFEPKVHASEADATVEAERLAGVYRGQRFGIFVLSDTREADIPTYGHEWQNFAARGEKIRAIKELRAITGMGLKPAKDAVEYFLAAA